MCIVVMIFFCFQDGNTFCTTLSPRLFTMDLTIVEHKVFFHEVQFCNNLMILY